MNKTGEKYLPIGTVVMLEGGEKRVMITGFCPMILNENDKKWDYSGCIYPEGFLDSKHICLFNHKQIKQIYHLALSEDEEEIKFKQQLNKIANTLK